MASFTPNFHFILPGPNDPTDQDLWGGYLNENFSEIDTLLAGFTIPSSIPVGAGLEYWGTTAPSQWVFAYGQALNRTTYADLFAIYGTTYGPGDGSTTFNIPDKRGRASFGKDDMGGTSANRLTGLPGGIDGDVLGGVGGTETHTLVKAEVPPLITSTNYLAPGTGSGAINIGSANLGNSPTGTIPGTTDGGGGAHNNVPPGIICNYIIYTGV